MVIVIFGVVCVVLCVLYVVLYVIKFNGNLVNIFIIEIEEREFDLNWVLKRYRNSIIIILF